MFSHMKCEVNYCQCFISHTHSHRHLLHLLWAADTGKHTFYEDIHREFSRIFVFPLLVHSSSHGRVDLRIRNNILT